MKEYDVKLFFVSVKFASPVVIFVSRYLKTNDFDWSRKNQFIKITFSSYVWVRPFNFEGIRAHIIPIRTNAFVFFPLLFSMGAILSADRLVTYKWGGGKVRRKYRFVHSQQYRAQNKENVIFISPWSRWDVIRWRPADRVRVWYLRHVPPYLSNFSQYL